MSSVELFCKTIFMFQYKNNNNYIAMYILFVPNICSLCLLPKRPPVWKNLSDAVVPSSIVSKNVEQRMHTTIAVWFIVIPSMLLSNKSGKKQNKSACDQQVYAEEYTVLMFGESTFYKIYRNMYVRLKQLEYEKKLHLLLE